MSTYGGAFAGLLENAEDALWGRRCPFSRVGIFGVIGHLREPPKPSLMHARLLWRDTQSLTSGSDSFWRVARCRCSLIHLTYWFRPVSKLGT